MRKTDDRHRYKISMLYYQVVISARGEVKQGDGKDNDGSGCYFRSEGQGKLLPISGHVSRDLNDVREKPCGHLGNECSRESMCKAPEE